MKVFLVMNKSEDDRRFLPYRERYRLFKDQDDALKVAREMGYKNPIEFDSTPGMLNMFHGGDTKIEILPLEIE